MLKILVADDHAIVREGLKQILSESADMRVAGEAASGWQVLEMSRQKRWDMILLDITMPGGNGLETLKQLKKEKPHLPVLMLSMHPEEQYAIRSIKAGVAGYLTKESAPQELVKAIRKVARGGRYISSSLSEKMAVYLQDDSEKSPHERLSDREYQVARMIADGKTVTQIADELCLSVKTISTNRTRALRKMGMHTNAEITTHFIKHGLAD
ncbi:Response regulator, GerE family [Desulfosarcina cetonica]|uniref:response regulator n=1 Tax=Desulfosarcina cetonica TaxID=90730 RepID=UPI0006D0224B|nr:response regulator transcription factor [Desulfosarcina cetonica]VTR65888.1 Response regulator, GerE family [Desulfosarcina cetonica]